MKIKKAVITAAGFGSRFLPFVKNIPKEMLPVIDKPSIQYLVEECIEAGIEEIIIVVREEHSLIQDYFFKPADNVRALLEMQGKMDRFVEVEKVLSMDNIKFVQQEPGLPYGNGSPILSAKPYLNPDEPFAMLWGDDMVLVKDGTKGALAQLVDFYETHECDAVTAVQVTPREELNRYGIICPKEADEANGCGLVEYIIEKPEIDQAPSNLVSYGRMIQPYRIFDYLIPTATGKDKELWLQDAADKLMHNGRYMYKIIDGEWMTTGDPIRYLTTQLRFYIEHDKLGPHAREAIKKIDLG